MVQHTGKKKQKTTIDYTSGRTGEPETKKKPHKKIVQ